MKALITLIIVLLFGSLAIAQDQPSNVNSDVNLKVETPEEFIVVEHASISVPGDDGDAIARLYRFRNSHVLKELNFTTKKNRAKLA